MSSRSFIISVIAFYALATLNCTVTHKEKSNHSNDEKAIRGHIDKIIQAYIKKDSATVRITHSDTWRGFLSYSDKILRGISDYMKEVDRQGTLNKLRTWHLVNYKMQDYDIVFNGKTAIVSYIAELFWEDGNAKGSYKLRSVDVYGKEKNKWIQIASNIGPLPVTGN
jgi:hypothetical protein